MRHLVPLEETSRTVAAHIERSGFFQSGIPKIRLFFSTSFEGLGVNVGQNL